MRIRIALTLALTALGIGLAAAPAQAWRAPTSRERRAIARATQHSSHAFLKKRLHVNHIHVSSVGPWASAVIAIYINHEADNAIDVLHKVGRRWRLTPHSPGTYGEACGVGMPHRDQRNLELEVC